MIEKRNPEPFLGQEPPLAIPRTGTRVKVKMATEWYTPASLKKRSFVISRDGLRDAAVCPRYHFTYGYAGRVNKRVSSAQPLVVLGYGWSRTGGVTEGRQG